MHEFTLTRFLVAVLACASRQQAAGADDRIDYDREIRPILAEKCFVCHGPDDRNRKAGVRLDTSAGLLAPRRERAVVTPGNPDGSELVRRITHNDVGKRMPPAESRKQLSAAQVELIRRWISQGAVSQRHWSYEVPRRSPVPALADPSWAVNAIDAFIGARLDRERLAPSLEADQSTLLRRLHFDLIGLPPTAGEVESIAWRTGVGVEPSTSAAVHDSDWDTEYERCVDRLLNSPHFGERLAMHWLDLVRYADTVGYHGDQEHHIAPYRDYVIAAFNQNKPFDQFTIEQLAGDLLPRATLEQRIATGYLRVLQTSHEGGVQRREYLAKYAADRVRNLSAVWMGATLGCAECHAHKFDPYSQRDFYSLTAFFADLDDERSFQGGDTSPTRREPELEMPTPQQVEQIAAIEREIRTVEAESARRLTAATTAGSAAAPHDAAGEKELAALRQKLQSARAEVLRSMVAVAVEPRPTRVLHRGDWQDNSGEIVQPAIPAVFGSLPSPGRATRLDLARWLVSAENPLTARVVVNRLWQLFFGRGLAVRLDDFGAQGEPPVHPELLDWLACELVESGWDVKQVVRLIVLSRTYRQSSLETATLRQRDPDNRLCARQARPRLAAEMIRDNALATSGLLTPMIGGRSVRPYQPDGYYQHLNFPKRTYRPDRGESQYRRGVYTHWQRCFLHPMLKVFDAPSREECTPERPISNTPLAALVLLNDPTFVEASRALAERIITEGGSTDEARVGWAWQLVLSRPPTARELLVVYSLVAADRSDFATDRPSAERIIDTGQRPVVARVDPVELAVWTSFARMLFNLDETMTRY